jgi:hypothetical protein
VSIQGVGFVHVGINAENQWDRSGGGAIISRIDLRDGWIMIENKESFRATAGLPRLFVKLW